jgi:hypothetical protein
MAGSATALSPQLYYRHSGNFSTAGAVMALLLGIVFAIPAAWLYGWFDYWSPIVNLTWLATAAFGIGMGAVTDAGLRRALVRNVAVAVIVSVAVALVGLYFSWAVWVHAVTKLPTLELTFSPVRMWQVIATLNAKGVWQFRSATPTGIILWLVWIGEAGAILGCAVYFAAHEMQEGTFCENCAQWAKSTAGIGYVAAGARPEIGNKAAMKAYGRELEDMAAELRRRLEAKDFAYLEHLGSVASDAIAWFTLDLQSCRQCGQTNTLRLSLSRKRIDRKKVEDKADGKEIFRQLLLSPSEAEALRKLGERMAPQLSLLIKVRPGAAKAETPSGG